MAESQPLDLALEFLTRGGISAARSSPPDSRNMAASQLLDMDIRFTTCGSIKTVRSSRQIHDMWQHHNR